MEGFEFQFVDLAFLIAFVLLSYKIYITIKKLNRSTYQDPRVNPYQREEDSSKEESSPTEPKE